MLIVIGLALILALTAATGFFVAQEFSYVAVDRNRLQSLAEAGDPLGKLTGSPGHRCLSRSPR